MSKIEVLRRIIDECDYTLKECFVKRMDASNQIANEKIEQGVKIYDEHREKYVLNNATAGLDRETSIYASTLWKTILRMSRARQYRYYLEKGNDTGLSYLADIVPELPLGDFCCASALPAFSAKQYSYLGQPIPVQSEDEVVRMINENEATYGIVKIQNMYDTEHLYTRLVRNKLYVNQMIPLDSGSILAIFSKYIVCDPQNNVTSVYFRIVDRPGELAHCLSILSDRRINVEFIRFGCEETSSHNIVCVELAANMCDENTKSALMQLSDETAFFQLIGARKSLKW